VQLDRLCTLTMLFRNPTVRSLAAELHAGGVAATEPVVLELVSCGGQAIFCICVFTSTRSWPRSSRPTIRCTACSYP
jgi:hypothetical protein